jgi:23S rRNA (guanosine2251-2'-O)-methyltransferase
MAVGPVNEVLYGRNPVRECLLAGRRAYRRLLLAEGVRRNALVKEITAQARRRGCPVESCPRGDLTRLAGSRQHQGVVLEAGPYAYVDLQQIEVAARKAGPAATVLMLDQLQDPQNVGTLLRTAEVVGVQGIVLPERRAAEITPAVLKASAGASEHLRIAQVKNLARAVTRLQEGGLWVLGLEDHPEAVLYTAMDWDRPLALVVGSEGSGLRRLVREKCDGLVRLPMRGQIDSLNAAVAGSVVLYEVWRGRQHAADIKAAEGHAGLDSNVSVSGNQYNRQVGEDD